MFRILINIDKDLRDVFMKIERYFSIALDESVIEKIFKDAEVSQKDYLIFQGKKKLLQKPVIVRGTVDEYEPSDIWIVIENITDKDVKHFTSLISK